MYSIKESKNFHIFFKNARDWHYSLNDFSLLTQTIELEGKPLLFLVLPIYVVVYIFKLVHTDTVFFVIITVITNFNLITVPAGSFTMLLRS